MISADARSRITPKDLDLLGITVEHGGAVREGLDRVLDRREVVSYLMGASLPGPSPSLLFYVLVRHALLDVVGVPAARVQAMPPSDGNFAEPEDAAA